MYTLASFLGYSWAVYFNTSLGERDEWAMLPHFFATEEDATCFLEDYCAHPRHRLGVLVRREDYPYTLAFVGNWQYRDLQPISEAEMEKLRPCKI